MDCVARKSICPARGGSHADGVLNVPEGGPVVAKSMCRPAILCLKWSPPSLNHEIPLRSDLVHRFLVKWFETGFLVLGCPLRLLDSSVLPIAQGHVASVFLNEESYHRNFMEG